MKLFKKVACIAFFAAALPSLATAGDMGTVYTQVGLNGLGIGYAKSVSQDWAVRGQYNALPKQSYSGNVGDFGSNAVLNVDINWSTLQLLGDWYPGQGGFRLSGGAVLNNNKITIAGTGTVNNVPNQNVNAEIKMSDGLTPYLGIGYSTRPKDAKGIGFTYDLGAMFQNPKSTLTSNTANQADIDAQNAIVQDAINNLKVMPAFSIGISYSF
ncbi:MAG: hypothetical protein RIR09_2144 [Pseudomonadota bacterium]|jgi:hypothetical protein